MAVPPREAVSVDTHNLTLAHHRVSSSSEVEHPTRSRRVVGSNPIWYSDFPKPTCVLEFTSYYVGIGAEMSKN